VATRNAGIGMVRGFGPSDTFIVSSLGPRGGTFEVERRAGMELAQFISTLGPMDLVHEWK
jgi:hypothetical protein